MERPAHLTDNDTYELIVKLKEPKHMNAYGAWVQNAYWHTYKMPDWETAIKKGMQFKRKRNCVGCAIQAHRAGRCIEVSTLKKEKVEV